MITLTLAEVAEIVGGQLNGDPHIRVDSVEFDSRKVTPHTLFVALRGARVDGHDFATSVDGPVLAARPVDAPSVVVPHIDNPQSTPMPTLTTLVAITHRYWKRSQSWLATTSTTRMSRSLV